MNSQFNEPGVFKICNYCREEKPFNENKVSRENKIKDRLQGPFI